MAGVWIVRDDAEEVDSVALATDDVDSVLVIVRRLSLSFVASALADLLVAASLLR